EVKDISRIQREVIWYEAEVISNLWRGKEDSNEAVVTVEFEEHNDIVIVRHITNSTSVRNDVMRDKSVDIDINLYAEKKIMKNIKKTKLITKREMKNGSGK